MSRPMSEFLVGTLTGAGLMTSAALFILGT